MSTHAERAIEGRPPTIAWLAWVWVVVPFLYGLFQLLIKVPGLIGY